VTVRFEPRGEVTDVVVRHERIADTSARDQHERGWLDCLDGLEALVTSLP
jgi:Activator of Hsp90 ATPase homolog 1-like protein